MSSLLIDSMDIAWASSNAALLQVTSDPSLSLGAGLASNRLVAQANASGVTAEHIMTSALDLSSFDEIRFWIQADRPADGSLLAPYFLEFSYIDAGDAAGEFHRWLVPVNQVKTWEQRRIGIQSDRRSSITSFRVQCLVDFPFLCNLEQLLAVQPVMLADLEQALVSSISQGFSLPGVNQIPLLQAAADGSSSLVVALNHGFSPNNHVLLQGGSAGSQERDVASVTHDQVANTTRLDLSSPLQGNQPATASQVTLLVPVIFESPPVAPPSTTPIILATYMSVQEDGQRTGYFTQRDSFRLRGAGIVCSVRTPARAYQVDYELTVIAPIRDQQIFIQNDLLQHLSMDLGLPVNGVLCPVTILPPFSMITRQTGLLAPLYIRIGASMETGPRQEIPWVRQADIRGAPLDSPQDQEGTVLKF
jgi:hypothetical protein